MPKPDRGLLCPECGRRGTMREHNVAEVKCNICGAVARLRINKPDDLKCSSCGGDYYHYAGCRKGEHGEIYLPCNRWIERAVTSLIAARMSDSFVRLPKWKQDAIRNAIVDLEVLK